MDREELKEHCKRQVEQCELWAKSLGKEPSGKIYEEHKRILELLEQRPCEDAISRQAAIDAAKRTDYSGLAVEDVAKVTDEVVKKLENLPPVTPQPKTGRWIPIYGNVKCSVCGNVKDSRNVGAATHYCDFCGAKMVEPQESEE